MKTPPEANIVTVSVMGRPYKIKCDPKESIALQESARYLTTHMESIREAGTVISSDRIAVIAALNMAHEFLSLKNQKSNDSGLIGDRIEKLRARIEKNIQPSEKS